MKCKLLSLIFFFTAFFYCRAYAQESINVNAALAESTWTTFTTADGLASNSFYSTVIEGQGNVWFGTPGSGTTKYDGTKDSLNAKCPCALQR